MSGAMITRWKTIASQTMTQSQVRERNSCQPSRRSRRKHGLAAGLGRAAAARLAGDGHAAALFGKARRRRVERTGARSRRPHRKRRSPGRKGCRWRSPSPNHGGHEHAAQGGAHGDAQAFGQTPQGVGLLQAAGAHGLWHEPGLGGAEERFGRAAQELQHDEFGDGRPAGDQQPGHDRLAGEAHDVGDEHHPLARQAVGPHAADQQEATSGTSPAAMTRPTSCIESWLIVEHGKSQRDRGDRAAYQ